ncbi:MAG: SusC/RagA family TonB-linked outer membrane protein, partial [Balneolales bacterium]
MRIKVLLQKVLLSMLLLTLLGFFSGTARALQFQQNFTTAEFDKSSMADLFYKVNVGKKISVDFEDETVEQALKQISEEAGLRLTYRTDIISGKRVTLKAKEISVSDALADVLGGTGLEPRFSRHGYLLIAEVNRKVSKKFIQETVRGTVSDATSEDPLPGVNIIVKGGSTGLSSNLQGEYELTVPSLNDTLVFSYIGYQTVEIPIDGRTEIDIALEVEVFGVDDLVVVGYGTQRRSNVTGSISRATAAELQQVQEQPLTNVMQGLAGRFAGVQVQQTGHAPGNEGISVRIRGTGSITAGNEPLYVLDGFPLEGGASAMSMISPNDISSVEILKDASSTAIYGSRGGNGVVLITTKSGESGEPRIELSTYSGMQQIAHKPEMMNTRDYVEWFIDGHNNAWIQAGGSADDPNEDRTESYYMIPDAYRNPENLPNVNWADELFRNAHTQNYQGSVSGGTENIKYSFGGGYSNQQGIMIGSDFEKMNIRAAVSGTVRNRLDLGLNVNASHSNSNNATEGRDGPADFSLRAPPVNPVWNDNLNQYGMALNSEYFVGDDASPIEAAVGSDDTSTNLKTLWRGYADLNLGAGLNLNTSLGGIFNNNRNSYYRPSYVSYDSNLAPNPVAANSGTSANINWLWENTLNYSRVFNQNELNAVAGFTHQTQSNENNLVQASNFPNDDVQTLNAGQITGGNSFHEEFSLASYLARIIYSFDDRYLLSATARTDGSSRFGRNNKWGFFPSGSLGWRISQEDFMQTAGFLSELKLRFSLGLTGNNAIPNYGSIGLLQSVNNVTGAGTGAVTTGIAPNTISNPDLSWEKTKQADVGLELGLFENRVYLELDLYRSITNDLLLNVPISTITGYTHQLQNLGKVKNQGLEFSLHTRNIQSTQATWNSSFNISFNKNIVLATGPGDEPIYGSTNNAPNAWVTTVGEPIASFYGYDFIGVFQ